MRTLTLWHDLLSALGLLSRLPLPAHHARGAEASWAYPLAGAVLGGIASLIGLLASALGLPAAAAAVLTLTISVLLTGALHEDGLADTADGLWGGQTPARRLEIMKDSRIGAYGVIALVLALLVRWIGLTTLFEGPDAWVTIVGVAALSRAVMPVLMATLPHARTNGLSRAIGRVGPRQAGVSAGLGILLAYLCFGLTATAALLFVALVTLAMARLAMKKICGQTGDILGASQQMAEIAILLTLMS